MSLLGSIRLATNALRADQIAMQVIGQNIANANTPGYIREEVALKPGPTQRVGRLLVGSGVEVEAMGFRPLPPEELLPVARKLLSLNIRLDEGPAA